tara:strand:+ start:8889 stop:9191 length:303 start_codon:yes stop_codon:yes gene_type:complete
MTINLLNDLEKISINFPCKILKIKGFVVQGKEKDFLEILIYKGFSSSTTHPIEINSEKNILNLKCTFNCFQLFKSPLVKDDKFIKETKMIEEILDEKYWL